MFKAVRFNQNGSPDLDFNTTGVLLLDITPDSDVLRNTLLDNENAIIMVGYSKINDGIYHIAHAKFVSEALSINNFNNSLTVYPNPIIDQINFSEKIDLALAQIFDINGKLVVEFKNTGLVNSLKIALDKGFYICKITNFNGEQKNFKLIKS